MGERTLSNTTVHLIVEEGPERGRRLSVPEGGARLGRASGNDIVLNDPSISRFQCRFYYRAGRDLCVADLASTNETLVNGKPVSDVQLFSGDQIMVGESVLRVVCDTLAPPTDTPGAEDGAVPQVFAPPPPVDPRAATVPIKAAPDRAAAIDLGLGPEVRPAPVARTSSGAGWRPSRRILMLAGVAGLTALVVAGLLLVVLSRGRGGRLAPADADEIFEIRYEKIDATQQNLFRYELTLQDGRLRVQFHDVVNQRQGLGEQPITREQVRELRRAADDSAFFALNREYEGVSTENYYLMDLAITIGNRVQGVRVLNRPEPESFRRIRERIETFAHNELGFESIAQSREQLMASAQTSWLNARKLYDEREVRRGNLARALKECRRLDLLLQTIEPKPPFYEDAVAMEADIRRQIDDRYRDGMFQADQAIRLRDWETANRHLMALQELLDDRSDERYESVERKMIDVQRRLRR
jgi:hypothetical protein